MANGLRWLQKELRQLSHIAEEMIPEAVKELNRRLRLVQEQIYKGELHEIPASFKSSTREAEARLIEGPVDGSKVWHVTDAHFPGNTFDEYRHIAGWPNLGAAGTARGVRRASEHSDGEPK